MPEPYMPHGWMHALVRFANEGETAATVAADPYDTPYGTVVDELPAEGKVKVRWPDGTRSWERTRDLAGWRPTH